MENFFDIKYCVKFYQRNIDFIVFISFLNLSGVNGVDICDVTFAGEGGGTLL